MASLVRKEQSEEKDAGSGLKHHFTLCCRLDARCLA